MKYNNCRNSPAAILFFDLHGRSDEFSPAIAKIWPAFGHCSQVAISSPDCKFIQIYMRHAWSLTFTFMSDHTFLKVHFTIPMLLIRKNPIIFQIRLKSIKIINLDQNNLLITYIILSFLLTSSAFPKASSLLCLQFSI